MTAIGIQIKTDKSLVLSSRLFFILYLILGDIQIKTDKSLVLSSRIPVTLAVLAIITRAAPIEHAPFRRRQ